MYYHVWFITKYRRDKLLGKTDVIVKRAFEEVSRNKKYEIIAMGTNMDHVHMLVKIQDRTTLSVMIRVLKSVSARKVLAGIPEFCRAGRGHFWARRYGCREVPTNQVDIVREYIRNQTPHLRVGNGRNHMRKRVEGDYA